MHDQADNGLKQTCMRSLWENRKANRLICEVSTKACQKGQAMNNKEIDRSDANQTRARKTMMFMSVACNDLVRLLGC